MFIFWLRHIVKTAAFRSYSLLSVLLRLIRHCQSILNGKEEDFRERPGGLTLSSRPGTNLNQPDSEPAPPVSLAVPLLKAPLQSLHTQGSQPQMDIQDRQMPTPGLHGGSNDAAFNMDFPPNSSAPSRLSSASEAGILEVGIATPPPLVAPGQTFDITLTPITPYQVKRYRRDVRVKNEYELFLIEKGPLDCSEELAPVAEWDPLTQPEGALIFYQPYKRVFTDVDVRDPETMVKINKAVEKAYQEARNASIPLDPLVELGLELMVENDEETWGYYFVDHKRRVIFWFEDNRSHSLMNFVRGVERKSHIKYALESQYWTHIELFPNRRFLPDDIVVELKELIMFAQADSITSQTSLVRFTSDQIPSILSLVDLITSESIAIVGSSLIVFSESVNKKKREHSVWITARFMKDLCKTKFENFCGQPSARLIVDQSLYEKSNTSQSMFFCALNVIFFGSPDAQSRAFHKILVDRKIIDVRWKQYMDKLNSDWNGYTIFSTVMLAVDISFLTVPSVQTQTLATLLSYMSTLCTMGSLVVTLLLVARVNKRLRGSNTAVASFLIELADPTLDIENFPLMLSLPFGFLVWGIAFFAAALSVVIFNNTSVTVVMIAVPMWVSIVTLAVWPIVAANRMHITSVCMRLYMWYWNTSQFIIYLWHQLYTWCWITGQHTSRLWNRVIEQVSPTATTPSHV
ncbi:uncharacterized protein F5147DRAFT_840739 [Suillus discolor]|uniref:Uncharacterized protein n=1 Tax=Suillus discolor TaxID=1912936 RepID=A0A9P7EWB1_9AGAM|nr:uncharacterized protein F5147DRAFT_840739 [Suillus discolor]KAG2091846.1 hypothetical protein F5147DRAFT_840739 [Suillus discolor]